MPVAQLQSMSRPTLRPYQVDAVEKLRGLIRQGKKRIVLVMPTGGGKTVVASDIILSAVGRGSPCLFLAHRKELIDQTVEKLHSFGVQGGVIMADDPRRDDYLPVQVGSVQTLARRLDDLPRARLVIVDECHHAISSTYQKIIERLPDAIVIGMTATPWRSDKVGLSDIYEDSILSCTPAELMAMGALVYYDVFAYDAPDLHEVKITAGDYNQKDLGVACNTKILVGSVVREYVAHAMGRRGIVFPVNVAHSIHLVEEFRNAGVDAVHIDAKTKKDVRTKAMERFRHGDLTILSSCGVLVEGFDAPATEVLILARPTKSLSLYLQMVGRGLRPSPNTGKLRALIHDHAGNVLRHGFPDDERDYSLNATPAEVQALRTCPACYAVYGATKKGRCPNCNELIAVPEERAEAKGRSTHEEVDGRRISRAEIEKIRGRRSELGLERELNDHQLAMTAAATREQKAAEYLRLQTLATQKGFQKGFVGHQFRGTFAHWPRFSEEELKGVAPAPRPFLPLPSKKVAPL